MEEQNERYNSSLHQKSVRQIRNPHGGVLNVQSDLDVLQGDVDAIQSIPILNQNSVLRTAQKGSANQTITIKPGEQKTISFSIPISPIQDLGKAFLENNLNVTANQSSLKVSNHSIQITGSAILYTCYVYYDFSSLNASVVLSGDWRVYEFY